MSLKHKLLDMYEEKLYTTELERVACDIESKDAINKIREEMNVINKI